MRVIVLQKNHRLDSAAAEEYGQRIFILENFVDPFDTSKLLRMYDRKLKQINFNSDEDLICLTGPSILLQLFLAVLSHRYNHLKVLMFNAPDCKYKLRTLEFDDGAENKKAVR